MTVRQRIDMRIRGPVVEGKTAPAVAKMIRDIDKAVADDVLDRWVRLLRASVKRWTGAYRRGMKVKHTAKQSVVTDGGSRYGPWLEGVSHRNKTTRFKGYHAQRRARQEADRNAKRLAEGVVTSHMRNFE